MVERAEGPWTARVRAALNAPWTVAPLPARPLTGCAGAAAGRTEPAGPRRRAFRPRRSRCPRSGSKSSPTRRWRPTAAARTASTCSACSACPTRRRPSQRARTGRPSRGTLVHELLERMASPTRARRSRRTGGDPVVVQLIANFVAGRCVRAWPRPTRCSARRPSRSRSTPTCASAARSTSSRARTTPALIVDYKSDRVGDADLAALTERAYATQRAVYALAALEAGFEPSRSCTATSSAPPSR